MGKVTQDNQVNTPSWEQRTLAAAYVPDIDGLRAIAVVAVLLFHAGIPGFGGGFVGVDVFFVISGYLITGILWTDLRRDRFSVPAFYERRVRRIVPALLTVLLFCLVAGYLVLTPTEFGAVRRSIVATIFFGSNVFFWRRSDYFAPDAALEPLLHTWSLSIEEQFYIAFPLLLPLALWPAHRRARWLAGIALAGSFALGVLATLTGHQDAAFYLPFTRAWELLAGGVLALGLVPALVGSRARVFAAVAGAGAVSASIWAFSDRTPFPSPFAAIPCLGTVLLLHTTGPPKTPVHRILASPLLVQVGLLSYSLYLWHWPLLVFAHLLLLRPLMPAEGLACLGIAVPIAVASWRFVERRFRGPGAMFGRKGAFAAAGGAASALLGACLFVAVLPSWMPPEAERLARFLEYDHAAAYREGTCFLTPKQSFADYRTDLCFAPSGTAPSLLVWGDSHAAHYAPGFRDATAPRGIDELQATASSCPPLLDFDAPGRANCRAFNDGVVDALAHSRVDAVVLSANWAALSTSVGPPAFAALGRTLELLGRGHRTLVVMGPSIQYEYRLPMVLARRAAFGGNPLFRPSGPLLREEVFDLDAAMSRQVGGLPGVIYVSVLAAVCPHRACPEMNEDRVPLQWDAAHLTAEGSRLVVSRILPTILPVVGTDRSKSSLQSVLASPPRP